MKLENAECEDSTQSTERSIQRGLLKMINASMHTTLPDIIADALKIHATGSH